MKNNMKIVIFSITSFVLGLTFITYAGNYNSEEISYDTSISGAVQANVKDALDFLYNKTKSGASSECPENMSCVEKPGVVMNVTGPGTVDKGTVYVGLNESNTFTVTPNEGYTLASISCDNGYTLSSYSVLSTAGMSPQEITITNPGTTTGATCTITFSTNEISITSTYLQTNKKSDTCNSASAGCVCWYIKNGGSNFNYGNHTGCNFKSKTCTYTTGTNKGQTFDCGENPQWNADEWSYLKNGGATPAACSGVITCAT